MLFSLVVNSEIIQILVLSGREDEADEIYKAMINVQKMKEENEEDARKKQKDRIKARYFHEILPHLI